MKINFHNQTEFSKKMATIQFEYRQRLVLRS